MTDSSAIASRIQTLLASFRYVGLPLLQAMFESPDARKALKEASAESDGTSSDLAATVREPVFAALVEATIDLTQALSANLGVAEDALDSGVRWSLASAASQLVAAGYKTTGHVLATDEATLIAETTARLQDHVTIPKPKDSEEQATTLGLFRAHMAEAMVPVIGAIAQYAFGRAEHALLTEVADRLVRNADQVTRALAPAGATPQQWRTLFWSILRAAGHIYAESHYAEADRLLYMDDIDRKAYFAKHADTGIPMTQVWQAFKARLAMLATLATYLDVPASANLED